MIRIAALALFLATAHMTIAAPPTPEPFGKTADGVAVERYTLKNAKGVTAKIMTRGATLTELHVPDKSGKTADVVLGFDNVAGYESDDNQYFGCTVGRVGNRIKEGKFKVQAAIQGEQLRVTGKKKDELQEVIHALRAKDFEVDLQFTNFRD